MVERLVDEVGDYVAVLAGHLAGPVDIEIACYGYWQSVVIVKEVAVKFTQQLGYLVWGVQMQGDEVFFEGEGSLAAIYRAA